MVTRTGTNKFHGGGMFNGASHSMGFANYSDSTKAQLLAAVPPTVLREPEPRAGRRYPEDLRHRRMAGWPHRAGQALVLVLVPRSGLNQYLLASYNPDGTQVLDDNKMWTMGSKIAWQVTRTTQVSYFDNLQYKLIGHRNGGGTFAESRARNLNDKYPDVHQLKFTSTLSNRAVVDVSYSVSAPTTNSDRSLKSKTATSRGSMRLRTRTPWRCRRTAITRCTATGSTPTWTSSPEATTSASGSSTSRAARNRPPGPPPACALNIAAAFQMR
jgi:hypothetical protein